MVTGCSNFTPADWRRIARLLFDLGTTIRDEIRITDHNQIDPSASNIHSVTAADTIYEIDKVSEEILIRWFRQNWPDEYPAKIIAEGLGDESGMRFPKNASNELLTVLIDPIDGTRGLMYDKRSAWVLAGAAEAGETEPTLSDLRAGAMVEIPTSRQSTSDGACAWNDGEDRYLSETVRWPWAGAHPRRLDLRPSEAEDLRHGFATFASFFPEGRSKIQEIEEAFLKRHLPEYPSATPLVFTDQYISSGGQLYELMAGRDRFVADLRPLVFQRYGPPGALACHPYDLSCLPVAKASGCLIEDPWGQPILAPLDTTSPVAWVGYANEKLAAALRPLLMDALSELGYKAG